MRILRIILGDQLTPTISALADLDRDRDVVLMVECRDEATYVRHHKQKIVLALSAMRHFAESLRAEGLQVDYIRLDSRNNSGTLSGELRRALSRHKVNRVVVTEPGEWRVWEMMKSWISEYRIPVEIREDDRFLCSRAEFADWAAGRKQLRMEHFYRYMRRKTGWLMTGDKPRGGQWNYDADNRWALPRNQKIPRSGRFVPDGITRNVMTLVGKHFADHFGDLKPFRWAVTRNDARKALRHFIRYGLSRFGDYQDAMKSGEDFLFHSILSPYINIGLLTPLEVSKAVMAAGEKGSAPLNAVEGFIRQILGWREFVRGIYWLHMPDYAKSNFLRAKRSLPEFYWSGNSDMKCLGETIGSIRCNAYAHHIQRLMITGNFALLAGIAPDQVEQWYLIVFADAFEWVELPNTHGMALHADGGLFGSKPYAASGAYINRMSDYCEGCRYSPKDKLGSQACPFNYLYWNFLIANEKRLKFNPRMAMPYRTLGRMTPGHRKQIKRQAKEFLAGLDT